MILERSYKQVFKTTTLPSSERRYVVDTFFARDPRTGIYGLLVFKHDALQICIDYEKSFRASLNKDWDIFDGPIVNVDVSGWGEDMRITATSVYGSVYIIAFNTFGKLEFCVRSLSDVLMTKVSLDKSLLLCATSEGRFVKNTSQGQEIGFVDITDNAVPICICLSPDGRAVAMGDAKGRVHIHDADYLALTATIEGLYGDVADVAFVGDSTHLLIAERKGVIKLYTLEDMGPDTTWVNSKQYAGHSEGIFKLAVCSASSGERFASAGMDGTVCIWDVGVDDPLHTIYYTDEAVCSLNFSPDGLYLATSTDEGNTFVYSVPESGEFIEQNQFPLPEEAVENFWELDGCSLFDPQPLRKALGIYDEDHDAIVFLKMKGDPALKMRDVHYEIAEEDAARKREEEEEMRVINEERERQRRLLERKAELDLLREAALRDGVEFEEPALDPSDAQYLAELQELAEDAAEGTSLAEDSQNADELAAQAGVLLSDSDEDMENRSDSSAKQLEYTEQPNIEGDASGGAAGDSPSANGEVEGEEQTSQLWATDDEEEKNDVARTRTTEELRQLFDEVIDNTANESQDLHATLDNTLHQSDQASSNDDNEPKSPVSSSPTDD